MAKKKRASNWQSIQHVAKKKQSIQHLAKKKYKKMSVFFIYPCILTSMIMLSKVYDK